MSSSRRFVLFLLLFGTILGTSLLLALPRKPRLMTGNALPKAVAAVIKPESKPVLTPAPALTVAPQGTVLHSSKRGETMSTLVRRYLSQSTFMTGVEFRAAVRQMNPELKLTDNTWLKDNQTIIVPGMTVASWTEKSVTVPKEFEVRAIYLTGTMAGSAKGVDLVRDWRKAGGNAVVFDIKDSDGPINIPYENKLTPETGHRPPISNLPKYAHFLHEQGMHAIARIAIFRDQWTAEHHPELTIHSRTTGMPWKENGKLVWVDPSNPEYQNYIIGLAKYAAQSGVDEIQFDYVRFPAEGDQKDAKFAFEGTTPEWKRSDVIANFLGKAYEQVHPAGVLMSLDVFGVMAWQRSVDLSHTGQDIVAMAKHCDVLSPMIYPSHFFGMDGYADPGDAPEHFIAESMDRFAKITVGSNVVLRPWLQAFAWRTKTYSPDYIRVQVETSRGHKGNGFLFWNARNDYSKPFAAMPVMLADPAKYFRSDKVTKAAAKPAETPGT